MSVCLFVSLVTSCWTGEGCWFRSPWSPDTGASGLGSSTCLSPSEMVSSVQVRSKDLQDISWSSLEEQPSSGSHSGHMTAVCRVNRECALPLLSDWLFRLIPAGQPEGLDT